MRQPTLAPKIVRQSLPMMETRKGNNDGHYLRLFWALLWAIGARIVVAEENARRWFHFDQWHIGSSFDPSRSIEFLFSHSLPRFSPSSPSPSPPIPLYSECEKREVKGERRPGRGARRNIISFSLSQPFSRKERQTNPAINNRVIDKLKPFLSEYNMCVCVKIVT